MMRQLKSLSRVFLKKISLFVIRVVLVTHSRLMCSFRWCAIARVRQLRRAIGRVSLLILAYP